MNAKKKQVKSAKDFRKPQNKPVSQISGKYAWVLVLAAFLVFTPLFSQQFINYDDDWMIYENPYVTNFSGETIKALFTDFYMGQYSPVSMTIIGLVHQLGDGDVLPFKVAGLLIHLVNALLIFILLRNLFRDQRIALIGMAFFAIHPVQVESVAWLSASFKVGIFALFSLASLVFWERFTIHKKTIHYGGALIMMALACFSKEQALVLPLFMLLISWYRKIPLFSPRNILQYLPFLALGAVFVVVTYLAVSSRTEVQLQQYSFGQRVYYLTYSFILYFRLLLFPGRLSLFYGIPEASALEQVVFPVMAAGLLYLCYRVARSNRQVIFAFLFVLFSLILTFALQLVTIRDTLYADRYLYLGVPMFFIALVMIVEKRFDFRMNPVLIALLVVFAGVSYLRAQKFEDSEVVWTDAIEKGYNNPLAYNNRGHYYRQQNKTDLALRDYEEALRINPRYFRTLNNRGKIYFDQGKVDIAMEDFNKAISIAPDFTSALSNRGAALASKAEYEAALVDLDKAIRLDSADENAYSNRALVFYYTNRFPEAISDVDRYLRIKAGDPDMHNLRALAYRQNNQFDKALEDFNMAIALNGNQGAFYQNRSFLFFAMGNPEAAYRDIIRAQQLGITADPGYIARVSPKQ